MHCFFTHLKPGGVAIIEGWIEPKKYRPGLIGMTTFKSDDINIARMNLAERRGKFSIVDLHYMIGEAGKPIRSFVDPLTLRLWENKEMLAAMQSAGFEAVCVGDVLMKHRMVFVGMR